MRKWFSWVDTKKIIKIYSLTLPTMCVSQWGPAQEQQEFKLNEVRLSLLAEVDDNTVCPWGFFPKGIFARRSPGSANKSKGAVPRETALPACHYESTGVRARKALALSFVDKDLALRAIPKRIIAQKSCARAYVHLPARSSTFGKLFPAAAVASKSRQPNSCGRPQN